LLLMAGLRVTRLRGALTARDLGEGDLRRAARVFVRERERDAVVPPDLPAI
jgi:hypothetical protein